METFPESNSIFMLKKLTKRSYIMGLTYGSLKRVLNINTLVLMIEGVRISDKTTTKN